MDNTARKQSDNNSNELCSEAIEACRLIDQTQLLKMFNSAPLSNNNGAGWHNSDQIETLKGLSGQFLWAEDPENIKKIQFTFEEGTQNSKGTYTLHTLDNQPVEEGTFYATPNNPAIGWAFIGLQPNSTGTPRSVVVSGMMTTEDWEIQIMLLNKVDATGPVMPSFSCVRI